MAQTVASGVVVVGGSAAVVVVVVVVDGNKRDMDGTRCGCAARINAHNVPHTDVLQTTRRMVAADNCTHSNSTVAPAVVAVAVAVAVQAEQF